MSNKNLKIRIFDTTLRDGAQTPGASLTLEDKIEIANQLNMLGVDVIEAGSPMALQGEKKVVSEIAKAGLDAEICALSRARKSDIDAAIDNAVTAAFLHSGQVCSAGTRLIVERSIHDRVVNEIVRRAGNISLGGPDDELAETGPLISKAHLMNVALYVEKGVAEGATLLVGGKRSDRPEHADGWYFLPTVFDNCNTEMFCVQEESFGPVMTVESFDTEAQAIAIGNDTVFGLSGGVWTGDSEKAARVAAALRHGTIWVNDFGPYRPAAEWGGYKQSGIGRELGEHGLGEYLEIKHIWTNNAPSRSGWFRDNK